MTTTDQHTIDLDALAAPFLSAEITAALDAAVLNTSLLGIETSDMRGATIKLSSSHCGRRGFTTTFDYYVHDDAWANGCGNIDRDQEAAIAIVRSIVAKHTNGAEAMTDRPDTPAPTDPRGLIEQLADIEHQRWADWQRWMHSQCAPDPIGGGLIIPKSLVERWERQINTFYADLSESEKESDREQVRRYLHLVAATERPAADGANVDVRFTDPTETVTILMDDVRELRAIARYGASKAEADQWQDIIAWCNAALSAASDGEPT